MSWTLTKKLYPRHQEQGGGAGLDSDRELDFFCLSHLFPSGGATDIVFVTLFCIAVGTAIAWCRRLLLHNATETDTAFKGPMNTDFKS